MKNPTIEDSETEAIRSDIEHTRESMDRTIDKISERMKPRHWLEQALDLFRTRQGGVSTFTTGSVLATVGKGAGCAARGMAKVVRQYPVPSLLIGAGITWAVVENRRKHRGDGNGHSEAHPSAYGESSAYDEPLEGTAWEEEYRASEVEVEAIPNVSTTVGEKTSMGEKASNVREKISKAGSTIGKTMKDTTHNLKEKTQKFGQRISEGARAVGRTAQRGYTTSRTKFVDASDEYPIAMGVGFLAAGVLLGLALPHSRKEDQWMGRSADRARQQAKQQIKSRAQDLMERGKQVASAATSAATQAAKDTAKQQGLTGQQSGPGQQQPQMSGQPGFGAQPPV